MSREQIVNTAPKRSRTLFDAGNERADETTVSQRRERVQTALTGDFVGGNRFGGETAGLSPMTAQAPPNGGVAQMSKGGKGDKRKNIQADHRKVSEIQEKVAAKDDEIGSVSAKMGLLLDARTRSINTKAGQVPEVQDLERQIQQLNAERAPYSKNAQNYTISASERQAAIAKNTEIVERRDALSRKKGELSSVYGVKDNPELAPIEKQMSVLQKKLNRLQKVNRNQALEKGFYDESILPAKNKEDMLARYNAMRSGLMSMNPYTLSDAEIANNYLSLRRKSARLYQQATAVHTSNSTGDSCVANEKLKPYAKEISLTDLEHGGAMRYAEILGSILETRGNMIAKSGSSDGWHMDVNIDDLSAIQEMLKNGYGDFKV